MIVKMDTAMVNRVWATYYGGSGDDDPWAIRSDGNNSVYVVGYTNSTSGNTTASSFQQFYGLIPQKLQRSELGQIPETAYKPPGWRPAA